MDPLRACRARRQSGLPRACGDGPDHRRHGAVRRVASPRMRGWTRTPRFFGQAHTGFPAHAGMDPSCRRSFCRRCGLPRACGDGPVWTYTLATEDTASPRMRGWTRVVQVGLGSLWGFPAHAGMDPRSRARSSRRARLPRACGDGPAGRRIREAREAASPRMRGWTHPARRSHGPALGFPAHAGMDPCTRRCSPPPAWLPRACGDGPCRAGRRPTSSAASPRMRGWTLDGGPLTDGAPGFPAHAGMDPRRRR